MNKKKLIKLRCKAWGITEDEYYCNQCSDFSLEDMARAYRRGKNKGRADLEKENANLRVSIESTRCAGIELLSDKRKQLAKATELIEDMYNKILASHSDYYKDVMERAKQFLSEMEE